VGIDALGLGICVPAFELAGAALRREPREDTIRIVEYAAYPRRDAGARARLGFTRDLSASGLCLGVDSPERVGALLRVTLRDVDGSPYRTAIQRVVWCSAERDGRYWLGLEQLSARAHAARRGEG
jgi:hypothetical protein